MRFAKCLWLKCFFMYLGTVSRQVEHASRDLSLWRTTSEYCLPSTLLCAITVDYWSSDLCVVSSCRVDDARLLATESSNISLLL